MRRWVNLDVKILGGGLLNDKAASVRALRVRVHRRIDTARIVTPLRIISHIIVVFFFLLFVFSAIMDLVAPVVDYHTNSEH